jgi:DNA ligase 1
MEFVMSIITRPLLAETVEDINLVKFPVLATQKLDGIRALIVGGKLVSRSFKPIPNVFIRETLEKILPEGIDGEIMINNTNGNFNEVSSGVMNRKGEPDFTYYAFDYVKDDLDKPYTERINDLKTWFNELDLQVLGTNYKKHIFLLEPTEITNIAELSSYEAEMLNLGFEGVMIRQPDSRYKCGRSTLKEGILLKIKQFIDSEAVILGFEERRHNTNEQEEDAFGNAKRSTKKEGMVGADTLGNIKVRDVNTEIEFEIGTGFDDQLRKQIWENRNTYLNQIVKYKSQPCGAKDKPRFPVFLGFRHQDDMGDGRNV